jgi:hypothetical protein
MSGQIQYNYYNTVATKIDENTFIFRGKQNSPNLVLPNSVSYVSTKLKIRSSEGLVDIEHEPIAKYSKRVIVTFPLKLEDDTAIGETKEINLNNIISKSIRFDMNDTGPVIYLEPITSTTTQSVEGFCDNKKRRAETQKQIDDSLDKRINDHETRPHGAVGSLTDAELRYLASKISPMMSDGQNVDSANGDWECIPYEDNADTSKTLVAVGTGAIESEKAAENSIYHQAAINVIVFLFIIFVGSSVVRAIYNMLALKFGGALLIGFETLVILIVILCIIGIAASIKPYNPKSSTDPEQKKIKNDNTIKMGVSIGMLVALIIIMMFVYITRRDAYATMSPADFANKYGTRSLMVHTIKGPRAIIDLYKRFFPDTPPG